MKLCPYCDKEMEPADTVCPHCGRDWKSGVSHLSAGAPYDAGRSRPFLTQGQTIAAVYLLIVAVGQPLMLPEFVELRPSFFRRFDSSAARTVGDVCLNSQRVEGEYGRTRPSICRCRIARSSSTANYDDVFVFAMAMAPVTTDVVAVEDRAQKYL
jgi:hypothetical protein